MYSILFVILAAVVLFFLYKERMFLKEVWKIRPMLLGLAKNDFKSRYSGSLLGFLWAFIQPLSMVAIYWFVFKFGLKSNPVGEVPFILWLISGLIPWMFLSETITAGGNCMVEYNYLVKKIVFKIEILPLVKVVSAAFTHIFLVAVMIVIYIFSGFYPDVSYLQILYYVFCAIVLIAGIVYLVSALNVFVKDTLNVVGIVIQALFWATPIVWDYSIMPETVQTLLKLNPFYYIITGFRDCFIYKKFFWERPLHTVYFWLITLAILFLGTKIFNRFKEHFADVL